MKWAPEIKKPPVAKKQPAAGSWGKKAREALRLGLAWLGLAWLGLAWLGLAWLGLAWLGLAWLEQHGIESPLKWCVYFLFF
ncbi:MAG: hypothetical protein KBD82_17285 [Rhodoferax sp.]|uniref:hypothetical protein n=1 Tax=Rhodoferax sp. TaxID=50421 RepID=UPI001B6BBF54|nr:hypothetical protein [Rhodoferax sp.]MBP9737386.1 hypothetical protein [Rhodoferax sp.]